MTYLSFLTQGIAVCGSGFGTVIFAPLTQYLIAEYKWQGTLLVISGITFFCAVFGYMFKPLNLDDEKEEENQVAEVSNKENGKQTNNNNNNNNSDNIKCKAPENTNLLSPNNQIVRSHSFGHGVLNANHLDKISEEKAKLAMSLSQPLLHDGKHIIKRTASGTLDRPDAFYTGSLHNLARSHHSIHHADFDRYGSLKRRVDNEEIDDDRKKFCGCVPCSKETHDTIKKMMSFGLLRDPVFLLFVLSNFLTR